LIFQIISSHLVSRKYDKTNKIMIVFILSFIILTVSRNKHIRDWVNITLLKSTILHCLSRQKIRILT